MYASAAADVEHAVLSIMAPRMTMSLLRFCALTTVVPLLSMEGQRALEFHKKIS